MAIIDSKLEFNDGTTVSGSSGETQMGTAEIKLDAATALMKDAWGTAISPDPGEGNNGLVVNFQVGTAFSSSQSIRARLWCHTTSSVESGTDLASVVFGSGATAGSDSAGVAGASKTIRLPAGNISRFIGVQYSHITGGEGTGTMDAWLGLDTETPTK